MDHSRRQEDRTQTEETELDNQQEAASRGTAAEEQQHRQWDPGKQPSEFAHDFADYEKPVVNN